MEINKVSDETKAAIKRKSAFGLPNRPSDAGIKAETIKEAFFKPVVDITNSSITEIDRVVEEINSVFSRQEILPAYTRVFNNEDWTYDENESLFFIEISPETHKIDDIKRIKVYMSLLAESGYYEVSLYNIKNDGTISLYSDTRIQGFVVIGTNSDGYISLNKVLAENVDGLAKVAKTGLYNDLKGLPDLSQIVTNSENIADIIDGDIKVKSAEKADLADSAINATNAENAEYAEYAETAGSATYAETAGSATYAETAGSATYAETAGNADGEKTFDIVIKTQAEFETLIASPTWLGAKSVAFVGDGGSLEFTLSTANNNGIKIPQSVKQIKGFNNAILKVENLKGGGAALWGDFVTTYSYRPGSRSIKNLTVFGVSLEGSANAFHKLSGLYNCWGSASGWISNAEDVSSSTSCGFSYCENVVGCSGLSHESGVEGKKVRSAGFYNVRGIINCYGHGFCSSTHSDSIVYGFYGCDRVTNCVACGSNPFGGKGYGYYFCSYGSCNSLAVDEATATSATGGTMTKWSSETNDV